MGHLLSGKVLASMDYGFENVCWGKSRTISIHGSVETGASRGAKRKDRPSTGPILKKEASLESKRGGILRKKGIRGSKRIPSWIYNTKPGGI
jgi:hypothetical protein